MAALDLESLELSHGGHASRNDGVCLMEAVAYFAGEEHSDRPACACPVLTRYGIGLNDCMPAAQRQKLKALIPSLVGTRNEALEKRRGYFLAERAMHLFLPIALRQAANAMEKAELEEHAISLRQHAAILDVVPMGAAAEAARAAARAAEAAGAAAEAAEAAAAEAEA